MRLHRDNSNATRPGSVLVLVLALLIVLTSLALVMAKSMRTQASSASNYAAQAQAQAIAHGAAQYLIGELEGSDGKIPGDDELFAEAAQVGPGYFWVLKHNLSSAAAGSAAEYAFGLTDEGGKLSLNRADAETLSLLPNMTPDLAAAIVDWRDGDDQEELGGGESPYYLMLPTPYQAKNAPLETVEELLLIKDFTAEILYGGDLNQNGVLEETGADDATDGAAAGGGNPGSSSVTLDFSFDRGLAEYVTVYGSEANTDADGQTRVNVNSAGGQLAALLAPVVTGGRLGEVLNRSRTGRPFESVLDYYVRSGLQADEFAQIADRLTTTSAATVTGLVNLNTASRQVLLCLPGLEEADVQAILDRQGSGDGFTTLADVAEVLTPEKSALIGGLITVRSYFYSADIVAAAGSGRAFARHLVVFDTRNSPPRIVYFRDLTSLGWPLDPQILADLRAGKALTGSSAASASLTRRRGSQP